MSQTEIARAVARLLRGSDLEYVHYLFSLCLTPRGRAITPKLVRRQVEKELAMEELALDTAECKKTVADAIARFIQAKENGASTEAAEEEEEEEKKEEEKEAKKPKAKRADKEEEEEDDFQEPDDFNDDVAPKSASTPKAKKAATETASPAAAKKAATETASPAAAKKAAKETASPAAAKKAAKEAASPAAAAAAPADDRVAKLKMYISKCGVRKVWAKELAGMSEKQQVSKLEAYLKDELGMEGRPSLDKCKAIKAKLELKKELADIDTSLIISEGRPSRRKVRKSPLFEFIYFISPRLSSWPSLRRKTATRARARAPATLPMMTRAPKSVAGLPPIPIPINCVHQKVALPTSLKEICQGHHIIKCGCQS